MSPECSPSPDITSTMGPYGHDLIHQFVEYHATSRPDSLAVIDPASNKSLTYAELNAKGNQLGREILNLTQGTLEVPVALLLQNRLDFIVATIATLKAGCAYVPLSCDYPKQRIIHILKELTVNQYDENGNSRKPILITAASQENNNLSKLGEENFKNFADVIEVPIAGFSPENYEQTQTNICLPTLTKDNLAYIIYTSGSTGVPKGVMVEHGSLIARMDWFIEAYKLTPMDRFTAFLNPAFDASLLETWGTLVGGGTIYVVPSGVRVDPEGFLEFVQNNGITRVVLPAVFAARVWKPSLELPKVGLKLRTMFAGGEQLPTFPFASLPYQVVNCYGPTETTVQVMTMDMNPDPLSTLDGFQNEYPKSDEMSPKEGQIPPIGKAIPGVKLEIIGEEETGELWIGGVGLARGYWNNPTMTKEKFVERGPGDRWYRSGDLVRRDPISGLITWIGRIDSLVKVNGFLVEPIEVEQIILKSLKEEVTAAKVMVMEGRLVAFVLLHQDVNEVKFKDQQDEKDYLGRKRGVQLREKTIAHLPHYMIPSFFIILPSFPTTPNGKVDAVQLGNRYNEFLSEDKPEPELIDEDSGNMLQKCEEMTASVWSKVLKIPKSFVTRGSNFLQVGGSSLHALEMGAALEKEFGLTIPKNLLNGDNTALGSIAEFVAKKLLSRSKVEEMDNKSTMASNLIPLWTPTATSDDLIISQNMTLKEKTVLVFLHPEAGHLQGYNSILHRISSSSLNDGNAKENNKRSNSQFPYPIYGIQDPDLELKEGSSNLLSVSEMAQRYAQILRDAFPTGKQKYILCGSSFGGYLAWEMASILGQKEDVPLIFLFDSWSNENGGRRTREEENNLIMNYMAGRQVEGRVSAPNPRSLSLGCHRFQMGLNYTPQPLRKETQVVFFRTGSGPQMVNSSWWNGYLENAQKINFYEVDGDRNTFLQEPDTMEVADVMKQYIKASLTNKKVLQAKHFNLN